MITKGNFPEVRVILEDVLNAFPSNAAVIMVIKLETRLMIGRGEISQPKVSVQRYIIISNIVVIYFVYGFSIILMLFILIFIESLHLQGQICYWSKPLIIVR